MIHEYTFRIYYKDTDASGIAYHANYLAYAERARSEWFNEAGLPIDKLLPRGDSFVVCHADVTYKRPAPLNSLVKIKTVVKEIKAASCVSEQTFWIGDEYIATVLIEAVCVDTNTLRPKRIPADIRALYEKFLEKGEENAK
ncbi:MAG: YbgC/FadM family acyl-CoA thioesterase [Alphaproteobacteria bacterium]|nr:YbgC/FadM family acyl-CoA thioesterase [Alphaproteobacteria bacterium]